METSNRDPGGAQHQLPQPTDGTRSRSICPDCGRRMRPAASPSVSNSADQPECTCDGEGHASANRGATVSHALTPVIRTPSPDRRSSSSDLPIPVTTLQQNRPASHADEPQQWASDPPLDRDSEVVTAYFESDEWLQARDEPVDSIERTEEASDTDPSSQVFVHGRPGRSAPAPDGSALVPDVRTVQQERQAFLSQELDTQLMWEFKEPGVPALVARMQADHSQRRRDARAAAEARRRDARAVAEAPMRRAFELGMHFVMDFYDESQHNIPRAALDRALGQIQDPAQDGVFRMLNGLPRGVQVLRTPESEVFPPTSPIMDDYLFPEVIPETPTRRR